MTSKHINVKERLYLHLKTKGQLLPHQHTIHKLQMGNRAFQDLNILKKDQLHSTGEILK